MGLGYFLEAGFDTEDVRVSKERHIYNCLNRFHHPGEYFLPVCFGPHVQVQSLRPSFHLFYGQILKNLASFSLRAALTFRKYVDVFA